MPARFVVLIAASLVALVATATASADRVQETALAERYAPVVRIVAHRGECGPGKPYIPINVDALFGEPTVALRGPWGGGDLVKIGPTANDLAAGLYDYHLDFPGSALDPGCTYLWWERRITVGQKPTVYAHVVRELGVPGKLALQYWFFYVFNDWNNLHEGDWEMVQLVFDASSAAQALQRTPVEIGYSQHEGAERAAWGDEKLERVGGTHPVVHPAAGSNANFYGENLYLGSSAEQGVGCDDTRGPTFDVRPVVRTIPSDPSQARTSFPWIAFLGRWGELRPAFFNGPTGPNLKEQWTEPIRWSEGWRDRSYTVPGGTLFGPGATGFFCGAVGGGSKALVRLVNHTLEFGLLVAGLLLIALLLLGRVTWRPTAPLRLARQRTWGQILTASWRMYGQRLLLFVGIGLVLVPISLLTTLVQTGILHATNILGVQTGGESSGFLAFIGLAIGTALTLFGLGLVQAATACALVEIDEGRRVGPLRAYALAADSAVPLLGALVIAAGVISLLASSIFLIPLAVLLAGRWALIAPAIELERASAFGALRRSGRLVGRKWLKVSSLIVLGGALVLVAGPMVGVLLILLTDIPFWLVNVVAGIVYAVTMPLTAVITVYVYVDRRVRAEVAPTADRGKLPAEVELSLLPDPQ